MTEYITTMGNRMYLVPVQGGHVQAAGAVNTNPTHGFAAPNGANQNAIAGPAGGNGAHTTADNQENVPPRGARRRQRAPGQPSLRELRRRRAAINGNPSRQQQSRARRVLAALNGQQVRDLREVTLEEVTGGSAGARSEYIDLGNGAVPDAAVLQDPYSFPSAWTTFNEDA